MHICIYILCIVYMYIRNAYSICLHIHVFSDLFILVIEIKLSSLSKNQLLLDFIFMIHIYTVST